MLEDIRGLNIFGNITGVPGEVKLSLRSDGAQVVTGDTCISVVIFGIDERRQPYLEVSVGANLWNLDGNVLVPGKRSFMLHRKTFIESRAIFNDRVWFRWRANLTSDLRLQLLVEEPSAVNFDTLTC
jgi:hypothetical protein